MSGAIWGTAEGKSWAWWPWPLWRRRSKTSETSSCPVPLRRSLVLVGRFDDISALSNATAAFRAAAFTGEDFACVTPARTQNAVEFWSRLRETLWSISDFHSALEPADHRQLNPWMQRLLAAGGGAVLVCAVLRFPEACRIIEETGGRVGLW